MTSRRSVFLEALGDEAARLRPEVYDYVAGAAPTSESVGQIGVGEGVFEYAGSRFGRLTALLRPLIGSDLLVTRFERDVPFRIVIEPTVDGDGNLRLSAVRTFRFRRGPQSFRDVLLASGESGELLNLLGSRQRVAVSLDCTVSDRGHLVLSSRSASVRVGRMRIRLPRMLSIAARAEDGYDVENGRHTIEVTVSNPIVGVVMRYRGWFLYRRQGRGATE